jgi:hypothetical protein
MPNGSPEFDEQERPLLERFFAPVADCLVSFGLDHNLLLTRYWHQEPCWDFMFRHPLGGVGRIMIFQADDDLTVHGLWWVDRYEEFARCLRRSAPRDVKRDAAALAPALCDVFAEILGWRDGEWDEIVRGYEKEWSRAGKDAFVEAVTYYPIPHL